MDFTELREAIEEVDGHAHNIVALHSDVSLVRIIWVDGSGQHRCRVVPTKRFNNVTKKNGVGVAFACMGMTSFFDAPADETNLTAVGEFTSD
ncbi:protein flug [Fagus crenata]